MMKVPTRTWNAKDFESLKRAMGQVEAYQEGARDGYATHEPIPLKADPTDPEDFDVGDTAVKQALADRKERRAGSIRSAKR